MIRYLVVLLIIFLIPFWLLDFNTTKKQFEFLKIKKILSKDSIDFLSNIKKQSTKFINYKFIITKKPIKLQQKYNILLFKLLK